MNKKEDNPKSQTAGWKPALRKQTTQWTAAQRAAIGTVGRDVLVTASAGTGKTAVLAARAVERICDASDPARADSLLVLTFTDAAAEEMRSRIAANLRARFAAGREEALRRQLLLLDRAYISTIHAFCKRILTEFFYAIDLDPTFGILDADEQRLLKAELLEKTLQEAWEDEALAGDLQVLFAGRTIQPGRGSFVDRIIPLSEFLDSIVSREAFYARAAAVNDPAAEGYRGLKAIQKQILLEKLDVCKARLEHALQLDAQWTGGQYATKHILAIQREIEQCGVLLEQERFDLCGEHLAGLDVGRMPAFKKAQWDERGKELIKDPVDAVKCALKGLCDFALLCGGYEAALSPGVCGQTKTLLRLLGMFDANYAAAKRARNMLDFADLEHAMLGLLESKPEMAEELKRRFDYIFVDEYQDINAVQQRIIELLSRNDNVFVVGDIKQSIYGFRQSKPAIFLNRLKHTEAIQATPLNSVQKGATENVKGGSLLRSTGMGETNALLESATPLDDVQKGATRVDLQANFRCRQEIIDFVNALFGRVMTAGVADMDYDETARLRAGFPYPPFKAAGGPDMPVELYLLDEDSAEEDSVDDAGDSNGMPTESISAPQRQAAFIARRIQQMVGAETGTAEFEVYDKRSSICRPVQYRDIVILMRSLSHKAQDYVEMLRLAGVPVSSQSACGYFEATEISDCLCLLKVLDNADRDIELAALLRSPVFGVTDSQLAAIRLNAEENSKSQTLNSKQIPNFNTKGSKQSSASFYQAVLLYAKEGADQDLCKRLGEILAELNGWRRQVRQGSLADLLDAIFREKGLLSFYAALPNGAQRRANLLKLHDHAIGFEHFRTTEPGQALGRFVEFLEKLAEAEQDWAPAEPDSSSENAVRIMSVHKSKGLEFPVVFCAELNTPFNRRSQTGECLIDEHTIGLQVIDRGLGGRFSSMAHQTIAERQKRADLAEEMRILYVALTRAREKLILTACRKEAACVKLLTQCANVVPASCRPLENTTSAAKDVTADPPQKTQELPAGSRRYGVPDWQLAAAGCHLDWLLMGLARQADVCGLFELDGSAGDSLFYAERIGRDVLETLTHTILNAKKSLKSETTPPKPNSDEGKLAIAAFETIRENLRWRYPFAAMTMLDAKLSVSALTHRDDEFAAPDWSRAFAGQPAAVVETAARAKGPDALSLGSAVHLILEHIDLSQPVDAAAIEQTIAQLADRGLLNQPMAKTIDRAGIAAFFDSDLGKLALAAGTKTLREWPFTYALDPASIKRGQEHLRSDEAFIVLQGMVDMIIPTDAGLVIVDFKTDRVREATVQERAARYAEQVCLYARAAEDILNQPIAGAWLYFVHLKRAINVNV